LFDGGSWWFVDWCALPCLPVHVSRHLSCTQRTISTFYTRWPDARFLLFASHSLRLVVPLYHPPISSASLRITTIAPASSHSHLYPAQWKRARVVLVPISPSFHHPIGLHSSANHRLMSPLPTFLLSTLSWRTPIYLYHTPTQLPNQATLTLNPSTSVEDPIKFAFDSFVCHPVCSCTVCCVLSIPSTRSDGVV
jgi:hypothetical protein